MRLLPIIVLLGLASIGSIAQSKNEYLPPTPTVAALGKYVDAPISLATGTPEISVPLYEITVGNFRLPISLSYHAGGFRVQEESSFVGLGWSLNATGVVSRTIRHISDNGSRHSFYSGYEGEILDVNKNEDYTNLMMLADNPGVDGFPDLYVYNFNGHSGKFVFVDGIQMLPKKPIEITRPVQNGGWQVVDQSGNTYYFSEVERAKTRSGTTASVEDISWYLTKIITATNEEITFDYKDTQFYQLVNISETDTYKLLPSGAYQRQSPSSNTFTTTLYGKELASITFPQGKVEFVSAYDRQDISQPQGTVGALRLSNIIVSDNSGAVHRRFKLRQGYFGAESSTALEKRLKLLAVEEEGIDIGKTHSFEYSTGVELPSKLSASQDHWGYYNGKPNTSLVPLFETDNDCDNHWGLAATRETDPEAVKANLLTRVNYPTGGYVNYEYEAHEYGHVGGAPIDPEEQKANHTQYPDLYVMAYTNHPIFIPTTREIETGYFDVPVRQCVRVWVDIQYPPLWEDGSQSQAKLELYAAGTEGDPEFLLHTYKNTDNGANGIWLEPGHYKIKAIGTMSGSVARGEIRYANFTPIMVQKKYAGGVRVKKIVEHDGVNPDIVRKITYYEGGDPNKSSGSLLEKPNYFSSSHTFEKKPFSEESPVDLPCDFLEHTLLHVTSESQRGLGSGNHIGYREVQVLYGENGENGKTVSTFTTATNLTQGTDSDVSWRRGLLTSQKDFDNAGRLLRSLTNEYAADFDRQYYGLMVNSLGKHPCAQLSNNEFLNVYPAYFKQTTTILLSELYYLKKQIVETHGLGSGSPLSTTEEYFYDNSAHLQPTRTAKEVNDKRYITATLYPDDFTNTTGFIADLKLAHNIVPIEKVTWQENLAGTSQAVLSGHLFMYKPGGKGLLEESKALELPVPLPASTFKFANRSLGVLPPGGTTGAYSPFAGYVSMSAIEYDNNFNPIQVTPKNGSPTSYIWGYQSDFPIAKVDNAISTKIAYTGFENNNEGNWDDYASNSASARTGKRGYIGNLSKSGIPSDIYLITLWVKDGTGTPSIAGFSPKGISEVIDGWKLFSWEANITGQLIINSNGAIIDDVRLCPINSMMTTLTYDPLKGPLSVTDPNNVISYFDYDLAGRLKNIRDFKRNILKHFDYNYSSK